MASRFVIPVAQVGEGVTPFDGAKLYFYAAGTNNPLDTYSDVDLTIPNTNPVIADENGFFGDIFYAANYKVVLKDKNNVQLYSWDNVNGYIDAPSEAFPFYGFGEVGTQEAIDTGVEVYTWGGGDIADTANEFSINLTGLSLENTAGTSNPYFDQTPLSVPGDVYDAATNQLFNFGDNVVVTMFNGAEVNSDHTKFGNNTVRLHGTDSTIAPTWADNDFVSIQRYADLTKFDVLTQNVDFTFQSWVYFDTLPAAYPMSISLMQDGIGNPDNQLNWLIRLDSPTSIFYQQIEGGTPCYGTISPALVTGQWYFFEVCRAADTMYFFVDGVLQAGGGAYVGTGVYNPDSRIYLMSRKEGAPSSDQAVNCVLDGSFCQALFLKGVALHTSGYTPPAAPTVFNSPDGSFAMRIITDQGELTTAVYSGYGENLTNNDWSTMFSETIDGNTYIGLSCGLTDSSLFNGTVTVKKGVDVGAGVYRYSVSVEGFAEDPALNGVTQITATGYFETDETPIGFKLYTDYAGVEFDDGIASITQQSLQTLTATPVSVGLPEYGNMGTFYVNDGTDTAMDFILPSDVIDRTEYPPLVSNDYMDGTTINFVALADNTANVDAQLSTFGYKNVLTPALDELAVGQIVEGRPYTIRYSLVNDCWILEDLYIPDDTITTDMIQDEAVTSAKILSLDGSKLVDGSVTPDKLSAGSGLSIFNDTKGTGVQGGTFTQGAWRTRDLNSEIINTITSCSLSSNAITLPAGTYHVTASAPAVSVQGHQTRIYQTSGTPAALITGTTEYSETADQNSSRSFINGTFTLASSQTIELQHRCESTKSTNGFGEAASFGDEVYSIIEIQAI